MTRLGSAVTTSHDPSLAKIGPSNTQVDVKLTKDGMKTKATGTDVNANEQQVKNDKKSHSVKHQVQQQPKSKTALEAKCEADKSISIKHDTQQQQPQQQSKSRTTSKSECETDKSNSKGNIISQRESEILTKEDSTSEQKTPVMEGICSNLEDENCNTLLQIQEVPVSNPKTSTFQNANILWDGGSTLNFITNSLAEQLNLKGDPIKLDIITVGGKSKCIDSKVFVLHLINKKNIPTKIEVLAIEKISSEIDEINVDKVLEKFKSDKAKHVMRPASGTVDILIGFQCAGIHPKAIESVGHMLLMENQFGCILAGFHPDVTKTTKRIVQHATVLHSSLQSITESFHSIESLGVSCTPSCGGCRCGSCHPGGKNMSLSEERELRMIEEGLSFNESSGKWMARYPWLVEPSTLPDNRRVAIATLYSLEKRLLKNKLYGDTYRRQITDMLNRGVAREITNKELFAYAEPKFYPSHFDGMKPESQSTAKRVVFNSSAKINGTSLNKCLAKGPSLLNNMLGILLRFRQNEIAFIGDISKMYHSIDIPYEDQLMHLFLWRDLDQNIAPKTYAITVVNMGDRPSAAIAQTALRKSAEAAERVYPEASKVIISNSYMDDIPGSTTNEIKGKQVMNDAECLLDQRGFKIKGWTFSGQKWTNQKSTDQHAVQVLLNKNEDDDADKVL